MSIISDSNKAQQKAIQHLNGPQLIVAGAGTGKTRVITARVAWLITEKNVNTDEILALTFTDKAANEMSERVETMLPYGYVDLWILTFHSFCDKLLKRHALEIGLSDDYKLLDETESWLLVRKNLDRFNLDYYRPLGNPTKFIHALIKHFSRCKDEGIGPDAYLKYAEDLKLNNDAAEFVKQLDLSEMSKSEVEQLKKQEVLRINEIAHAYHVYQQILLENSCLDFGDLICYAIKLFKERPLILEKYRRMFKYILVDEFQDTNFVQYELIKMIASPKNNLTVVGDDNQSIYKFRGAAITNILQFKKDFPQSEEVVLTENYRSCQEILDLAYKSISLNTASLEKELGIDKRLASNSKNKCAIEFNNYATGDDEVRATIDRMADIKEKEQREWSSFAILTRANDSAQPFVAELERRRIPYQFLAMRGLYNKPIIVDVLAYFRLLDNYHESGAVYRALNFKWLGLNHYDIVRLVNYANKKSVSLYEAIRTATVISGISKETLGALNTFFVQADKHARLAKQKKASEIFIDFLYESGALKYLEAQNNQAGRDDMSYLQQFLRKIQAFEASENDPRVVDFLELINMEMEAGNEGRISFDAETGPDMVKILTIHSAKGLEFDYVFLPCLVERKFPTDERRETISIPDALIRENIPQGDFHLEEERRLFYVAMTRAKQGLFFSSADNYGGTRDKKISRFLVELGYSKPNTEATSSVGWQSHRPNYGTKADATQAVYELPNHFSFSQMQNYEKCPLKYKFGNVLKIPTKGSHYFSFGSTIHNTLQKYLEQCIGNAQPDLFSENKSNLPAQAGGMMTVLPLKKLLEIYDASWIDDWYEDAEQKESYRKKGRGLLGSFYEQFKKEQPNVRTLEHQFHVKIAGHMFYGRIDRIDDVADGKVEIIDYKTGSAPKGGKLETDDRRQLLLYQIVAENLLKKNVDKLTYYYLDSGERLSFVGKDKDKEALAERFANNIADIKAQKFDPTPSEFACKNCEYKDICEFKKV